MKKNVLMKKSKVLAFALAAAMAFPSVPMSNVHAAEAVQSEENGGVKRRPEGKPAMKRRTNQTAP